MRGRPRSKGLERFRPEHPLEVGPLPPHPEGLEWTAAAERQWAALQQAEARQLWTEDDRSALEALLHVVDAMAREGFKAAHAGERRRLLEQLGLTPTGRIRLGLEAAHEEEPLAELSDELARRRWELEQRLAGGGER